MSAPAATSGVRLRTIPSKGDSEPGAIGSLKSLLNNDADGKKLVGGGNVDVRSQTFAAYSLALVAHRSESEAVKMDVAKTLYDFLITDESALKDIRIACVIGRGSIDRNATGHKLDR